MALPAPTPTGFQQIPNNGFESGATGWTATGTANIVNESQLDGSWCVKATGTNTPGGVTSATQFPVVPGMSLSMNLACKMTTGSPGTSVSADYNWYNAAGSFLSSSEGSQVTRAGIGGSRGTASINATVPAGACYVSPRSDLNVAVSSTVYVDSFSWNYNFPVVVELTHPISTYTEDDEVQYRINVAGLPSGVTVASVAYYYMTWDGSDYVTPVLVSTQTTAPFSYNAPAMTEGQYGAYAVVTLSTGLVLTTNSRVFTVGEGAPVDEREYRASNSYTWMVAENFSGLGSAIPSTALVTGAEVIIDYKMDVLVRALDKGIGAASSNPEVAFAVVNSGTVQVALLNNNGSDYTISGAPMTGNVPVIITDFTLGEEGTTGVDDNTRKWAVYSMDDTASVTVGDEALLFGQGQIDAPSFISKALGIRFVPNLEALPNYADSGDACYRFKIDTIKLRVYFDAGSIEYYFTNGTCVIKGQLGAGNVLDGDLTTGDASGIMQLLPDLETIDGSCDTIGAGWTIHSAYPPTDTNQIGVVSGNMSYNALPTYYDVETNRSRYVFITANFYGDPALDSIYGANGVGRAFAYNGDYFYKIVANPDADKDKPRHVAYHVTHLALGYGEGRVDLSVVGEPYNFDGAQGASSWAVGDYVTGLLPLSGTMLGIFCKKSVQGLAGTTVDNFANQVISAKLGAVEYTVTDMGFPVYANSYGIYTLAQTADYGDFLGAPMSQAVSPWLRPRLLRRATSDKEVVVAWPVRSKNQYKLAFADGYVLTMTMNYGNQQAPTFSKQKYFTPAPVAPSCFFIEEWSEGDLYAIPDFGLTIEDYGFEMWVTPAGTQVGEYPDDRVRLRYIPGDTADTNFPWVRYSSSGDTSFFSYPSTNLQLFEQIGEGGVQEPLGCVSFADDSSPSADLFAQPSIVPAAISSELDEGGEERIHVANKVAVLPPDPPSAAIYGDIYIAFMGEGGIHLPIPEFVPALSLASGWAWGDTLYMANTNMENWVPVSYDDNYGNLNTYYLGEIDPVIGENIRLSTTGEGSPQSPTGTYFDLTVKEGALWEWHSGSNAFFAYGSPYWYDYTVPSVLEGSDWVAYLELVDHRSQYVVDSSGTLPTNYEVWHPAILYQGENNVPAAIYIYQPS